jgi:hypothetical protein
MKLKKYLKLPEGRIDYEKIYGYNVHHERTYNSIKLYMNIDVTKTYNFSNHKGEGNDETKSFDFVLYQLKKYFK